MTTIPFSSFAQTPAEVRQAFINLHDDKIPHNCEHATDWLFKYREQLKDDLLDEFYKTDWQGRASILRILYGTESFVPDRRFIHSLFADLREDEIADNCGHAIEWFMRYREKLKGDLLDEFYKTDLQGRDAIFHVLVNTESFVPDKRFIRFEAAGLVDRENTREDWEFISKHFKEFDPLLKEQVGTMSHRSHEMYVRWAIAWLAKKQGVFEQYAPFYTPAVLKETAQNLKNDDKRFNASQAVRLFLLLGDQSLPTLREAAKSSDKQAASLARATIDALGGSRKAFGFLALKTFLEMTAFGPLANSPDWLVDASQPYKNSDTYP